MALAEALPPIVNTSVPTTITPSYIIVTSPNHDNTTAGTTPENMSGHK